MDEISPELQGKVVALYTLRHDDPDVVAASRILLSDLSSNDLLTVYGLAVAMGRAFLELLEHQTGQPRESILQGFGLLAAKGQLIERRGIY